MSDYTDVAAVRQAMDKRYAEGGVAYKQECLVDRMRHETLVQKSLGFVDRHAPTWRPWSLLDIGCGIDPLCKMPWFAERERSFVRGRGVRHYIGLDVSPEAVERCKAEHGGPTRDFLAWAAEEIDAAYLHRNMGGIDVAVGVETIEHWSEHETGVRNLHAALNSGGLLILTTPNRDSLHARMLRKLGRPIPTVSFDHTREFGWWELDELVEGCGFERIDAAGGGFAPYWTFEGDAAVRELNDMDLEVNAWMAELADLAPEYAFCQVKCYRRIG